MRPFTPNVGAALNYYVVSLYREHRYCLENAGPEYLVSKSTQIPNLITNPLP